MTQRRADRAESLGRQPGLPPDLGGKALRRIVDRAQLALDEFVFDGVLDLAEVVTAVACAHLERHRTLLQPLG
ncbi:hypothetical protein MMAN_44980 [Mycobacterium mantenii]|uniref:Uncharacterized protein n=1 Tax=Mycobacterium mantenii TaxID=560555 RepID=A0ABN6ABC0_MYCNT|nr:hypothetical protein MMAN_44980 [Mycobacterium mantenii]